MDDVRDDEYSLKEEYSIKSGDFVSAGEVSSSIKKILKQIGIDGKIVRRASIAAYEAELNLVIHSTGGELCLEVKPSLIQITAKDKGPGIQDINLAMREGFSTAPDSVRELGFGAGMGLPNMKRCSDDFSIYSIVGQGTEVSMLIWLSKE